MPKTLTARNALAIVKKAGFTAWLPVQKGAAEAMGKTKVRRIGRNLISIAQTQAMIPRLQPGDILLQRREWHLSNIGIPGFWTHAALVVGTPQEREAFFDDPAVAAWVREQGEPSGDLDGLLEMRHPAAWRASTTPDEDGFAPRVLEAISPGVVATSLEHSARADSIVALRPRLSKREKAIALVRAFGYCGRPYDYNFDFQTDAALVCSELIYKSFEPAADFTGLRLPPTQVSGRLLLPPNDIARLAAESAPQPDRQFDLVLFLDGHEGSGRAVEATPAEFATTWQRPKWHIVVQDLGKP
jgi:hypothetical protein